MKKVAVSQRIDVNDQYGERRDALDQRLLLWLSSVGCMGFPVPNLWSRAADLEGWLWSLRPDGIVLSGGNDVGSAIDRDEVELGLLNFARIHHLRVLGICRGMQMMAVEGGGKLCRVDGHVGTRHGLVHLPGGEELPEIVNSYHQWGLSGCPVDYQTLAVSARDATIEAIQHKQFLWMGWMWHPERDLPFCEKSIKTARNLLLGS